MRMKLLHCISQLNSSFISLNQVWRHRDLPSTQCVRQIKEFATGILRLTEEGSLPGLSRRLIFQVTTAKLPKISRTDSHVLIQPFSDGSNLVAGRSSGLKLWDGERELFLKVRLTEDPKMNSRIVYNRWKTVIGAFGGWLYISTNRYLTGTNWYLKF